MPVDHGATILHVDLDAFFAAVEQRDHPELRGRPVIVGGRPGDRGVVSAASYEARRFGVRSAMPLRTAAALCPDGVFVPVRGERYGEVSRAFMDDPAAFDAAGGADLHRRGIPGRRGHAGPARHPRAHRASTFGRPSGRSSASPRRWALPRRGSWPRSRPTCASPMAWSWCLPGPRRGSSRRCPSGGCGASGSRRAVRLADYGVQTIGDLAVLPADVLVRRFGAHGMTLAERARGIDPTPVGDEDVARTVSHEHTFDRDTRDPEVIERTLLALAEGVGSRLRDGGVKAATVGVKIRDSHFSTHTRQRTLPEPTDQVDDIFRVALALARPGDPGDPGPLAGRRRLQPDGARAAFAVPGGIRPPTTGHGRCGQHPSSVWARHHRARPTPGQGRPRAVRAGPTACTRGAPGRSSGPRGGGR